MGKDEEGKTVNKGMRLRMIKGIKGMSVFGKEVGCVGMKREGWGRGKRYRGVNTALGA